MGRRDRRRRPAASAIWERLWESSVAVDGPQVARLVAECRERDLICAVGVNERESDRPGGTLYNTLLLLGPDGVLHRHRKLMPTFHERLFHGFGDGRDLAVISTPLGRIGGLICWENRMPLARYAVYRGGPQIWIAPTADYGEGWSSLLRTIAIEAGAFAVGVCQYVTAADYPADFPLPIEAGGALRRLELHRRPGRRARGRAAGRRGRDPGRRLRSGRIAAEKQWFDVIGHYAREDVLLPLLADGDR